jgi:hypothetical protein
MLTSRSFEAAEKLNLQPSYGLASALREYLQELRALSERVRVHRLESGRGEEFDDAQKLLQLLKDLWQNEDDNDPGTDIFVRFRRLTTKLVVAEAWLSSVGVVVRKQSSGRSLVNESATEVEKSGSPSQSTAAAVSPGASRESDGLDDDALASSSAYLTTPLSAPAGLQATSRTLRSWPSQPGSDPWQFTWMHESERALEKKRQREEEKGAARRKRLAEKKAALRLPSRIKTEVGPSTQPLQQTSGHSQPVQGVRMPHSQEVVGYGIQGSSQVTGVDMPGESMSQVVPGRFAQRMQLPVRKKRKVGMPKKAGFK